MSVRVLRADQGATRDAAPDSSVAVEAIDPQSMRQEQDSDAILNRIRSWVEAGQRPEWSDVSALDKESKAYYSQWASLAVINGLLYRRWQAADGNGEIQQLLVPLGLREKVLQLVHGAVG